MQNIKKYCLASVLGIGLMGIPGVTHALWLGNAYANVLLSTQYGNLGGLLPFMTQARWIGWFEFQGSYVELDKTVQHYWNEGLSDHAKSYSDSASISSTDIGVAVRYVWSPQLVIGGYCFINTPEMPTQNTVTLKNPVEINPGFELMSPYYQTALHVNLASLIQGRETSDLQPYLKGAWKIETKIYNRLMFSWGTYHYYDRESESPIILSGATVGLTYIGGENWSLFFKYNHDWYQNDYASNPVILGGQWKIGKTTGCYDRITRYLRQPLDRHIGPIEPFKYKRNQVQKPKDPPDEEKVLADSSSQNTAQQVPVHDFHDNESTYTYAAGGPVPFNSPSMRPRTSDSASSGSSLELMEPEPLESLEELEDYNK